VRADSDITSPRVSVVLAVYNGQRYLHEALASILDQTFSNFEFIVVNDGSTDGSRDIVLASTDSRIRLLDNPVNLGLTRSLNRGIAAARGEFIARLDADDAATPDRLARQVAFLDQHRHVALVGSWCRNMDENGRRLGRDRNPLDHTLLRWTLMFYCPFTHSAMMWRRKRVTDTVGLYDEAFAYAMDWEYWSRIASRMQVENIGRVLTHYRLGSHSMTTNHPRVETETAAAREASLRAVFGEDAAPWIEEAPRLFPLIDGWPPDTDRRSLRAAVDTVTRLHEAFLGRLVVTGRERTEQQRHFRRWLARRLLITGRNAHLADRAELGRLLFREARRVYAPALLTVGGGRYLATRMLCAVHKISTRTG